MIATCGIAGPMTKASGPMAGPVSRMPGCRSSICRRPGISRWPAPTAPLDHLQRRDLQFRRDPAGARGAGLPRFAAAATPKSSCNGWQAWGPQVFSRLRGMFALAIWDRRSQRLLLAAIGSAKSRYIRLAPATAFLFGSEIKAVLAWPGLSGRRICRRSIDYLTFGYVPAPQTAFDGDPQIAGSALPRPRGAAGRQSRRARARALLAFAGAARGAAPPKRRGAAPASWSRSSKRQFACG